MSLTLTPHPNAESFLAVALEPLAAQEAANGLILGLPLRIRLRPERLVDACFATVQDDTGALVGAAVRTPPYHLVVHVAEDAAADADAILALLLADATARTPDLNGVNGRAPWPQRLAQRWEAAHGGRARLETALRAFALAQVIPPPPAPGTLRKAGLMDFDAVAGFLRAFDAEALPNDPGLRSDDSIRQRLADGEIYLWVLDDAPVSLVGKGRPLPHGMTIAPVYTPPAQRGKGFASNCTAAVSQLLLDAGWGYCTLFTDLANPTSNSIYQKIGYQPVCDYADYAFTVPVQAE